MKIHKVLRGLNYHGCALSHVEAKRLKLAAGRLCDACEPPVVAALKQIKAIMENKD